MPVTDHWPSEACLFERGSGPFADLSGELGSLRDEIFNGCQLGLVAALRIAAFD
jgi:hypothetical protein